MIEIARSIIDNIPLVLLFLLILTFIVCVHEFGHFIMAKKFGVQVDEFSIGMGPLLYKRMWHGTQYSIRALPMGGYVKMLGEGESSNLPGSYSSIRKLKKLVVIYAGVLMNFITTMVIFTILALKNDGTFLGAVLDPENPLEPSYSYPFGDTKMYKQGVQGVQEDSPAQKAGLKSLDVITKVNGVDYKSLPEYSQLIAQNIGKETAFQITTYLSGDTRTVNLTPRDKVKDNLSDKQTNTGIVRGLPFIMAKFDGLSRPFAGILQTVNATHNYFNTLIKIVDLAIKEKDSSIVVNSVTGPVGTFAVTKRILDLNGFWGVLNLAAVLSLVIGIMNALPFPALDGWHGVFIISEFITKKKVNEKLYNAITLGGFMLLSAVGILITFKDILNFNKFFM
jgi:regulator of sigma E protease